MNERVLSDKEALSIFILFMIGTASVIVPGIAIAKRDMWMAVLIAVIPALLVALMFARMHYIMPKKDLFQMLEFCYGKYIGRILSLIYFWFFFHAGTLVSMDVTEFIKIVSLEGSPYLVFQGPLVFLSIYVIREGLIVLGRYSKFFKNMVIFFILLAFVLLLPNMKVENMTPVLYEGFLPVIGGAYVLFAFPLAQIIPFVASFGNLKTDKSAYNIYLKGVLGAGFVLLVIAVMNMLVLGPHISSSLYFPTHDTLKRLTLGATVQRVEIIADAVFVLGGFVKFSVYLLASSIALSRTFGFSDHKFIALPIGLMMINLSKFLNEGFIDHLMFVKTWPTYSLPFQVLLPVIFWITAEIMIRLKRKSISTLNA